MSTTYNSALLEAGAPVSPPENSLAMVLELKIHPSSSSIDLLGPPDPSSAYSLSGHISLSLTSPHSLFERRRAVRILLRSLVVTFEGQAELVTCEAGYVATRLCSISRELVSKSPLELSNEGHEDGGDPCTWQAMFDLPIPGWLPASNIYGDCRQGFSGTQYNLYATARFSNAEETLGRTWLSALCTPFSSKIRVLHAKGHAKGHPIILKRFALPPGSGSPNPAAYSITPSARSPRPEGNHSPIPADIVSKIQLLASVPERISVDEDRFPFTLSIWTPSVSESQAARLRVSHMSVELQQLEQYTSSASAYAGRYPLPSEKNQPPNAPLRRAHPIHTLYDIGLLSPSSQTFAVDDVHSLLPECARIDIPLDSADHAHKCAKGLHPTRWFTVEARIPFTHTLPPRDKEDSAAWMGAPRLRTTSQSPFFGVKHSIRAIVELSYDGADDGKRPATSSLAFALPLSFVRFRCGASGTRSPSPSSSSSSERSSSPDAPALVPATAQPLQPYNVPELPAYSQLFYPNGDVRHDDSIPLPVYTAPSGGLPTVEDVSEDGHLTSETSCLLPPRTL